MEKTPDIDNFYQIKYAGYCMSQLPPDGIEADLENFITFAKFHLCRASHRLMKDPIWDTYSDEELLVEYYALLFEQNKDAKEKMEQSFGLTTADAEDWFDEQIEKSKDEIVKIEDRVTFSPSGLED